MKSVTQQYIEEGLEKGIQLGKQEGIQIGEKNGILIGEKNGEHQKSVKIATRLIKTTHFDDQQIAEITDLDIKEVAALRKQILDQESK